MRTRIVAGVALAAVLLSAQSTHAQEAHFPWKAGDVPPALAGFHLGQDLAKARAGMPGEIHTDTLGSGPGQAYAYTTPNRALSIVGVPSEGVGIIYVRKRELGEIDGLRVGDTCEAVLKRWGPPPRGDGEVALWIAGKWLVSARCDAATGRVTELSVGNVG